MPGENDRLEDPAGAALPDRDSLQADACAPTYRHDSHTRLVLESKDAPARRLLARRMGRGRAHLCGAGRAAGLSAAARVSGAGGGVRGAHDEIMMMSDHWLWRPTALSIR